MSKDLEPSKPSEEVDLGQLFKLIGNTFDRFFNFIGSIFNKLFLAFIWGILFIKKHILKLVIAGVIGMVLGIYLEKTSVPIYKSFATIKQNYATGENLYSSISYYKDLVNQNDVNTLKKALNIEELEAETILGFDVQPVITENQKLKNFDTYLKTLDSVVAKTVEYDNYIDDTEDYTYEFQQISIKAKARNNFKKVFDKIIENISTNDFFNREQAKDLEELKGEEEALIEALKHSDSLQKTYKRVLEKGLDKEKGSQTSITIEGSTQLDKTKEFDLYKSDLELRSKLVKNRRKQADLQYVIEVISSKQESGIADNSKTILGKSISVKKYYSLGFVFLTFLVLICIEVVKFLNHFQQKS